MSLASLEQSSFNEGEFRALAGVGMCNTSFAMLSQHAFIVWLPSMSLVALQSFSATAGIRLVQVSVIGAGAGLPLDTSILVLGETVGKEASSSWLLYMY